MEQEPVLHVWINHDHDLVDLTITTTTKGKHGKPATRASEVIHTNQKHPFFTMEHGFLPVGQIKLGMHLLRADGRVGVVTGWKVVPGTRTMYNLEVAQDHTFTVGVGQWVVHNDCPGGSGIPLRGQSREQYVRANLNSIFGKDMGTPGPSIDITTILGHTDVDIPTDTSLIEVAGQGHVSDAAQISSFYNKMQKYNAYASTLEGGGRGVYIAFDNSAGGMPPQVQSKLSSWGITIAQFTWPGP